MHDVRCTHAYMHRRAYMYARGPPTCIGVHARHIIRCMACGVCTPLYIGVHACVHAARLTGRAPPPRTYRNNKITIRVRRLCPQAYAAAPTCSHVHMCRYMYVCVHICICMYIHVHMCMYIYLCVCICMYVYIHVVHTYMLCVRRRRRLAGGAPPSSTYRLFDIYTHGRCMHDIRRATHTGVAHREPSLSQPYSELSRVWSSPPCYRE
jgi:hypothetical protein